MYEFVQDQEIWFVDAFRVFKGTVANWSIKPQAYFCDERVSVNALPPCRKTRVYPKSEDVKTDEQAAYKRASELLEARIDANKKQGFKLEKAHKALRMKWPVV